MLGLAGRIQDALGQNRQRKRQCTEGGNGCETLVSGPDWKGAVAMKWPWSAQPSAHCGAQMVDGLRKQIGILSGSGTFEGETTC
jgi:hypothetical protein